jgi:putrescine aminotransferase
VDKQPYPTRDATAAAFAAHVNRGKVEALRALGADIVIGARDGGRFADAFDGRWFWNCHCNGGVFNLGHRNPRVVRVVQDALDHLDIGNHHLISGRRARLAEQLAATTDGLLPYAAFGASGGEVVDLALKVARGATGRSKVVSAAGAFHGVVGFARWASDPRYDEPFATTPPGFTQVPFNDLAALDQAIDDATAAVILESIPATLGFPVPDPGYLRAAGELARERGALFILDEVQTGLGRTGTVWYYQQHEARPDIVIAGKGLGGGIYPIAAALMTADAHRLLDEHPFVQISTFGGAEVGCVAASTVLDIVTEAGFLEHVRTLGERFEAGFAGLPFRLRRAGLTMGLAFDGPNGGMAGSAALIRTGVFAVFADHDRTVTQFKPPLILTDEEADEIIGLVRKALV